MFTAHLGIQIELPAETTKPASSPKITFRGCSIYDSSPNASHKPPPGPVALHVCRESRNHARQHYRLAFRSQILKQSYIPRDGNFVSFFNSVPDLLEPRIWVNFSIDTIFLLPTALSWDTSRNCRFLSHSKLAPDDRRRIQKLAFPACWNDEYVTAAVPEKVGGSRRYQGKFLRELASFPACKQMMIYRIICRFSSTNNLGELKTADRVVEQMKIKGQMSSETGDVMYQHWITTVPDVKVSKEMILAERVITANNSTEHQLQWRVPSK